MKLEQKGGPPSESRFLRGGGGYLHGLKRKYAEFLKWSFLMHSVKKKHFCGRVIESLFLSKAGPKRGNLSYLIELRTIFHTSDVGYPIIDNQI